MADCVVLLGTKGGPAVRPGSPMPVSSLVVLDGQRILVDCGLGATRALAAQGTHLRDLSAVFVTHLHSDHYLELGPLLHTAWTAGRTDPLPVFGPRGLGRYWEGFLQSMRDDIELRIEDEGRPDPRGLARIALLEEGFAESLGSVEVRAMRVEHPPLEDSFALSFRSAAHFVAFSGDTRPMSAFADFARGADLLVHEAMLEEGLESLVRRTGNTDGRLMRHLLRSHTRAADAGRIAAQAGVKALAIHHLIPSDDPSFGEVDWRRAVGEGWSGPLHVGRDGLRIDLQDSTDRRIVLDA